MKILIEILIVFGAGIGGFLAREKYVKNEKFLEYILVFLNFYSSNIFLQKNNTIDIFDKFKNINKNAKFENIIIKNNKNIEINKDFIKKIIISKECQDKVCYFFSDIGKCDLQFENEKINDFKLFLNNNIILAQKMIKEKGDLALKIALGVGAILGILVW